MIAVDPERRIITVDGPHDAQQLLRVLYRLGALADPAEPVPDPAPAVTHVLLSWRNAVREHRTEANERESEGAGGTSN